MIRELCNLVDLNNIDLDSFSFVTVNFDIEDNLIHGTIPVALFKSLKLMKIAFGKNSFTGTIPYEIGNLEHLTSISFHENSLKGAIPALISMNMEYMYFHTNEFTGTIPSEFGIFKQLKEITFHHNSMKGFIPDELAKLELLEIAQFHQNEFEGIAPNIIIARHVKQQNSYITDCGEKDFLQCDTCTMCCDPTDLTEKCRAVVDYLTFILVVVTMTILIPVVLSIVLFVIMRSNWRKVALWLEDDRDPLTIYKKESVYSFLFTNNFYARLIDFSITLVQIWMFSLFVMASDADNKNSDWELTIRCLDKGTECQNKKHVDNGWVLLALLLMLHLGGDIVNGFLQVRKAFRVGNVLLFINGIRNLVLALFAMATSSLYNVALAESNTGVIVNAVILLFINDLDEKCMELLFVCVPEWTNERIAEVKDVISKCVPKETSKSDESNTNGIHHNELQFQPRKKRSFSLNIK